jgi:hypothetical protein
VADRGIEYDATADMANGSVENALCHASSPVADCDWMDALCRCTVAEAASNHQGPEETELTLAVSGLLQLLQQKLLDRSHPA